MFDKEGIFLRFPELSICRAAMEKALSALIQTAKADAKVLCCGNGGSCADSDHIVGELMKGFLKKRPLSDRTKELWKDAYGESGILAAKHLQDGIQAISLPSQSALLSAFCNDCDPNLMYAQLAWNYARKGDVLIAISTSGKAENVLAASRAAKLRGAFVLGLTGKKDSPLSDLADVTIQVPAQETYLVQEYHLPVYHWLCAGVEDALFEE